MARSIRSATLGLFSALALSACANLATEPTQAPSSGAATAASSQVTPVDDGQLRPAYTSVPQRGLPPQILLPGQCGLFMWSQTDVSKFIFFRRAGDSTANLLIGSDETELLVRDFSGDIFGQFFTSQKFSAIKTAHLVDVDFEPGEDLIDGARIESGRIRITDPEGWQTTIPVLGVRACQSEAEEENSEVPANP